MHTGTPCGAIAAAAAAAAAATTTTTTTTTTTLEMGLIGGHWMYQVLYNKYGVVINDLYTFQNLSPHETYGMYNNEICRA
jgi:hypothetical protein